MPGSLLAIRTELEATMNSTTNHDPLVREQSVAAFLNVKLSTIQRWRYRTRMEREQIGPPFVALPNGSVRYDMNKVRAWALSGASDQRESA